ncbi:MAG: Gldg family protein [Eubacterium sp.]|nr:Gldg family protein [Eubacterium sp.]
MKAIYKKEMRSFFYAPAGYVCVAAIVALYGFFYYQVMMTGSSAYVTAVNSMLFSFGMMLIPILTMRSMAEEKKNRTDQALLTAPVEGASIVIGKFLACFSVFTFASLLGLLPAVAMSTFATPPWGLIAGNFVGTLCYGAAMTAIGVFLSSLTANQMIAAVSTFAAAMFLMYMDAVATAVSIDLLAELVRAVSFYARYAELTRGMFSIPSIVYFVGVTVFFLYLTMVRMESTRNGQWRWKSIYAGKAALVLAIVIVCNVFAGVLVERFPSLNADMTAQKLNSMSDEVKEAVKGIGQEVTVYLMAEESAVRQDELFAGYGIQYSQVANLLDRMQELNPDIHVEFKSPSKNPAFVNSYAQDQLTEGDVLMVSSLRHRVLGVGDLFIQQQNVATGAYEFYSQADSALANGLAYVCMEEVPLITVATGHGEMLETSVRAAFDSVVRENAFEVEEIQFMTQEIPEDTSILFLPTPTTDYTEEEIEKIKKFLADDTDAKPHTVLFAAYPAQGGIDRLRAFLEEWGVRVEGGTVFETDDSRMFLTSPNTIFVKNSDTLLADGDYSYLLTPVSCPLRILFDSNDGIYVFPLLSTADTAVVRQEEGDQSEETGIKTVATYSYREVQAGGRSTYRNLIMIGSSMALTSPYINSESFGNKEWVCDLLRLATNTKSNTVVVPRQTALAVMDITASKKTIDLVGMGIFTITIPLCILVVGLIVYRKRRNL